MRSVFLIAIVAVAMIGVMVPSGFADNDITMKIKLNKANYYFNETILMDISISQKIPNTPLNFIVHQNNEYVGGFTLPPPKEIPDTEFQAIIFREECDVGSKNCGTSGEYEILAYYGNKDEPLATDSAKFYFNTSLNPNSNLRDFFPTKFQVGTDWMISHNHCYGCEYPVEFFDYATFTSSDKQNIQIEILSFYNGNPYYEDADSCSGIDNEDVSSAMFSECRFDFTTQENDFKCVGIYDVYGDIWHECHNESYKIIFNNYRNIGKNNIELFATATLQNIKEKSGGNENMNSKQIEFEQVTSKTTDKSLNTKIASFVDQTKDPQYYIDRYNKEPTYKEWFHRNYPQYDSIEQAVGLELTKKIPTWIKSIFGFYSQDKISEDELLNAIQYLIKEGILKVE